MKLFDRYRYFICIKLFFLIFIINACSSKPKLSPGKTKQELQPNPSETELKVKKLAEKSFVEVERDIAGVSSQTFGQIDEILDEPDKSKDNAIVLNEEGWITVVEERNFDGSVSLDEAKEKLLQVLRNKAVTKKVGTEVQIVSLLTDVMVADNQGSFEESAWSGFFRSTVSGLITEEKSKFDFEQSGNGIKAKMTLDAFVVPVRGDRDPGFYLEANLESNMLNNGDEVHINLQASQDCYVYILNLMSDNNAMLIYPNQYMEDNFIKGGSELIVPDEDLKDKIRFRVGLLPGQSFASESIYIICTKSKVPMLHNFPKVGRDVKILSNASKSFFELQKWLAKIPLNQRTEKALIYHVSK